MNRYTQFKFTRLYCERSTQTREGQDNSETEATEESDFGPCLISNNPPIMSCPSPVILPSRYLAAASNKQQKPIIIISSEESEEPPSPQPQHPQQLNTGLQLGTQTLSIRLMQLQLYRILR